MPAFMNTQSNQVSDFRDFANYSVAYEETQSNRVSDFRDFVCSLFLLTFMYT